MRITVVRAAVVQLCLILVMAAGVRAQKTLRAQKTPAQSPKAPRAKPQRARRAPTHQVGYASWYGKNEDQGKPTASGDGFNKHDFTAAHRTLPLGTVVRVTNLENGQSVDVTINDRGPKRRKAIIDLSQAAARQIGELKDGLFRVRVDVIKQPVEQGGAKSAQSRKLNPDTSQKASR